MKFKQLAAVGLVTAMVFSTAGCSSKSQQTESSAAQAEKTPENSQEKAQGGEPVEIVYLNSHADVWEGDVGKEIIQFQPTPPARTETAILHKKTNNSSSHFHNQITSYSLKSPPTCPAHIQNRSHCAVFPVRIPP